MNIAYKTRLQSPYQVTTRQYYKKESKDPVREEINKLLGTYEFTAIFEEDTQTASTLKDVPGLIAFLCTIKKGDRIIGQGRGTTVINQINRFIVRTINYAFNASLVDAMVRSTKVLDMFRPDATRHPWGGSDNIDSPKEPVNITDKQKNYLTELIQLNVADESERDNWISQIGEFTKQEASEAIQTFAR